MVGRTKTSKISTHKMFVYIHKARGGQEFGGIEGEYNSVPGRVELKERNLFQVRT